eukprot:1672629-Pyramimonas_sp.AAC.1
MPGGEGGAGPPGIALSPPGQFCEDPRGSVVVLEKTARVGGGGATSGGPDPSAGTHLALRVRT